MYLIELFYRNTCYRAFCDACVFFFLNTYNNYFTSGFLTLGLALRDSKVIIYGIDEKQGTAQVIPYEYDCESDAYIQNEHLSYTRQDSFFREATKEAVYWKMQSDRSNP